MNDHSVFWVCPILLFILTGFMSGIAMLSRDKEKPGEIPLVMGFFALLVVALFHWMHYSNKSNLNSIFNSGSEHMGYFPALFQYGTQFEIVFNFGLLILGGLIYFIALLIFIGAVEPPDGKC